MRSILVALLILATSSAVAISTVVLTNSHSMAPADRSCAVISYGAVTDCYSPSQEAIAEHQMPAIPASPSGIVRRFARLELSQVIIFHPGLQDSAHPTPAAAIDYIFGTMPGQPGGPLPIPAVQSPRFLIVSESVERIPVTRSQFHVYRGLYHDPHGKPLAGYLNLDAGVAGSRWSIQLQGNVTRGQMERVGRFILSQ